EARGRGPLDPARFAAPTTDVPDGGTGLADQCTARRQEVFMAHPHLIPVLAGTLVAAVSVAPLEAKATARTRPAGATAQCNDGTYSKAKSEQGACSSHGGVKTWYGEVAMPAPSPRARPLV